MLSRPRIGGSLHRRYRRGMRAGHSLGRFPKGGLRLQAGVIVNLFTPPASLSSHLSAWRGELLPALNRHAGQEDDRHRRVDPDVAVIASLESFHSHDAVMVKGRMLSPVSLNSLRGLPVFISPKDACNLREDEKQPYPKRDFPNPTDEFFHAAHYSDWGEWSKKRSRR